MIYVASPYTHPDPKVVALRFREVMAYTSYLLRLRIWCYSPIVHCHELANTHKLPTSAEYWEAYNRHMMKLAEELYVLALPGWRESVGVRGEMFYAGQLSLPIALIHPETYREVYEAQL